MDFTEIDELPDYMDFDVLINWFQKVLEYCENIIDYKYTTVESVANAFYELSLRQWHLYKIIDTSVSERIEKWIERIWSFRTEDLIETICGIICMLGIKNSLAFLKQSLDCEEETNIRFKLTRTIAELEEHDCDPYWSLK